MLVGLLPQKSTVVRKTSASGAWMRRAFALGSWIAPAAAVEQAVRLFCEPSPFGRERASGADDAGAISLTREIDGHQLRIYRWGTPDAQPYVLLAHGWSGFALSFVPLVNALRAAGFAVVAFDQPGHGQSSGTSATLPDFARCLAAVGELFGRAAAVIGHSMGGAAAAIALRDGLAADRAILIAPPADLGAAADRFADLVGLAPHLRDRLRAALEARASVRFENLEAHRHAPAIACPALIIHDLSDREVPWSEGECYARYWPSSRMITTTRLGHNRILGDTAVIGAVLDFLRGEAVGARVVSTGALPFGVA